MLGGGCRYIVCSKCRFTCHLDFYKNHLYCEEHWIQLCIRISHLKKDVIQSNTNNFHAQKIKHHNRNISNNNPSCTENVLCTNCNMPCLIYHKGRYRYSGRGSILDQFRGCIFCVKCYNDIKRKLSLD